MLAADRALVVLNATWSSHARRSRAILDDLEQRTIKYGWAFGVGLTFFEIDVSDQSGALWEALQSWLLPACDQAKSLLTSGSGTILWSSGGRVLDSVGSADQLISILERTRTAFDTLRPNDGSIRI